MISFDGFILASSKLLTCRQLAVMLVLQDKELDFREVAVRLKVPSPAISRAIDLLDGHFGYVRRSKNYEDGRKRSIRLTEAGREFLKDILA